ncbi:SDE2-like protein [Mya arenaria]|uniref:SDE2-like protein n=1 Tax=Mya arenaria TaxID=6604 RepID=A0ABY7F979_MYAAR|nr:SDE2-like protein [Mya arenaria]
MSTFVHSFCSRHVLCVDHKEYKTIFELKGFLTSKTGLSTTSCFLVCNGCLVSDDDPVKENVVYHTYLRIPGGKGGFGSMLRAIGAQIEKTTNREACRDLSGRRMRDVNNEKDLKEWLAKQSDREKERERRREERMARRRAMPNHKFEDPTYDQQRALLAENQEDALQQGLKKFVPQPGTSSSSDGDQEQGTKRNSDMDSDEDSDTKDSKGEATPGSKKSAKETLNQSTEEKHSSTNTDTCSKPEQSENSSKGLDAEKSHEVSEEKAEECVVSLEEATCAGDLEAWGLDRLKQELADRSLKCGGTLEQRAQRLFSVRGLAHDQIEPSLFAKSAGGKKVKNKQ